jgi:hypothetical protein
MTQDLLKGLTAVLTIIMWLQQLGRGYQQGKDEFRDSLAGI